MQPVKADLNKMTLGDMEEFELLSGCSMSELSKRGLSGRRLAALIYIFAKRENPSLDFKEVLDLDFDTAQEMLVVDEDPKGVNS